MMNNKENNLEADVSAGDLEGARRATGKDPAETPVPPVSAPNPEVEPKAVRRRFSAQYKRSVLEQADRCTNLGDVGALLRREGLYSSHLSNWRRQRDEGLAPRKRGRKVDPATADRRLNAKLVKENQRLQRQLKKAHTIIDVQKKLSEILGLSMDNSNPEVRQDVFKHVPPDATWSTLTPGYTVIPRGLTHVMRIMDSLSKGKPLSDAYFVLWCWTREPHLVVDIRNPRVLAFESGFSGQRMESTWRERMALLCELGFIEAADGPYGDYSYVLLFNPFQVVVALNKAGRVQAKKYQALSDRLVDVGGETDLLE